MIATMTINTMKHWGIDEGSLATSSEIGASDVEYVQSRDLPRGNIQSGQIISELPCDVWMN
jgi:hypothetical protein